MHEFCARHKVQDDLRVNDSTRRCQQAWRRTNRGVCSGDCHHSRHLDNSSCSGRSPCAVTVSNSTKLRSRILSLSVAQLSASTKYATVLFTCCHKKLLPLPLPCNDTYSTRTHTQTNTHTHSTRNRQQHYQHDQATSHTPRPFRFVLAETAAYHPSIVASSSLRRRCAVVVVVVAQPQR